MNVNELPEQHLYLKNDLGVGIRISFQIRCPFRTRYYNDSIGIINQVINKPLMIEFPTDTSAKIEMKTLQNEVVFTITVPTELKDNETRKILSRAFFLQDAEKDQDDYGEIVEYLHKVLFSFSFISTSVIPIRGASGWYQTSPYMVNRIPCSQFLEKCNPNQIGSPPEPDFKKVVIPGDSHKKLVGFAKHSIGKPEESKYKIILREQYWRLSSKSYVLAPGEKRIISFLSEHGVQETSSDQDTISKSLGVSAGGGWGPIQASISGSLNKTSTTMHSVTVSTKTTKYERREVSNEIPKNPEGPDKHGSTRLYYMWQLMDEISIWNMSGSSQEACLISAIMPCIVLTYDLEPNEQLPFETQKTRR